MAAVEERIAEVKSRYPKISFVKVDKNDTLVFADYTCRRCGGRGGAECWAYTGYTCYECGGSGRADKPELLKFYTPEYQAKLDAINEKRRAKKYAEALATVDTRRAEVLSPRGFSKDDDGFFTYCVLGDTFDIKDELKDKGCKFDAMLGWHSAVELDGYNTQKVYFDEVAEWVSDISASFDYKSRKEIKDAINKNAVVADETSDYIGKVGDKVEFTGTPKCVYSVESNWGYHHQTMHIYVIKVGTNEVVWKTSNYLKENEPVTLKGTIKELTIYKGKKQTEVTRCREVVNG